MSAQEVKTVKQRKDAGFDTWEVKELNQEEQAEFISDRRNSMQNSSNTICESKHLEPL